MPSETRGSLGSRRQERVLSTEGLGIGGDFVPRQAIVANDPVDRVVPLLDDADVEVRWRRPSVNSRISGLPVKVEEFVCKISENLI